MLTSLEGKLTGSYGLTKATRCIAHLRFHNQNLAIQKNVTNYDIYTHYQ